MLTRKNLIETLERIKPALADQSLIPIFTNYCFTGTSVYAYSDTLGIVAPCTTEQAFAVHGNTLLGLLKNSRAEEVIFSVEEENLLIKCGKSRIKLPYFDSEEFAFSEPEIEEWPVELELTPALLDGLNACLVTASIDHSQPALMGVVLTAGDGVSFYSCDGDAITHYLIDGANDTDLEAKYTIPNDFCNALIRIASKGKVEGTLYINEEWAIAELSNGYKVYGRIIDNPETLNHAELIEQTLKGAKVEHEPPYIAVPKGLNEALSRARVLADAESQPTTITIKDGKIKLHTDTPMGVVRDTVNVKSEVPSVEATLSAALMQRSMSVADKVSILPNCTCYRKGADLFVIVSNLGD